MRSTSYPDATALAPLGIPAIVLGAVLSAAAVAVADRVAAWGRDYGVALVLLAFTIHVSLAVGITVWGIGVRRSLRAERHR